MKSKYDLDDRTPICVIIRRLSDARAEGRIYVIANVVRVLHWRGYSKINLTDQEQTDLFKALQSVRSGKKVLALWLPLGYQTVRLISLIRQLSDRPVRVTQKDATRIKRAAYLYRRNGDWHSKRQLRSLVLTARDIGVDIQ